jgi:hypothetical protein
MNTPEELAASITELRALVAELQRQLNEQAKEMQAIKCIAIDGQDFAKNHKHCVNGNRETHMIYHS